MADPPLQTAAPTGLRPWQKKLILVGVVLVAVGISYLGGRLQIAAKVEEAEARAGQLSAKVGLQQAQVSKEQALVQRLEARRQMHLMLLSLDARNFGIAKQHQADAASLLSASKPEPESELLKLSRDVQAFQLVATEDLAAQRSSVLAWVKRFDQALPPPAP